MVKPMTLKEAFASARTFGMYTEVVWFEERIMDPNGQLHCFRTSLFMTSLKSLNIKKTREGEATFEVLGFGPDCCSTFYPDDYNKTWRCWRYEDRPDWITRNNTPWEDDE